jgi:hypothetical protein
VLGLLFLCGVGGAAGYVAYRLKTPAGASSADASVATTRIFTSRDGLVSVVAPATWKPIGGDDLSPAVDLGVCSADDDALVFNVNETAGDFENDLSLAAYAELVKNLYRTNLKATFRGAEAVDVAGYPALRFPFDGSHSGVRLRGFLFALRSPKNFHHLVVATVPSDYDRLIGEALAVVATTTIVPPLTPEPAPSATPL